MSTASTITLRKNDYPTSDGRPMAETDLHRELMNALIKILQAWFAGHPMVYVSGNLMVYYVPDDKLRHVAPDVFVVKGVAKHPRLNYLIWEEGKGPSLVIELTSASTRKEDIKDKFRLYQDKLKVPEYFLFDPTRDYLKPNLQGYRLRKGKYERIKPVGGRLPSKALDLHLEQDGSQLRLYDPVAGEWLPTPDEALDQAEEARRQAVEAQRQAEAEVERLRHELEALRRQQGK